MQSNFSSQDIERIVRMVVQRLMRDGAASSPTATASVGELRLDVKLVTVETLKEKLNESITVLCVPTKAVVTPAVKDELKQRGVELRRIDQNDCGQKQMTPAVVNAAKQSVSGAWQSTPRTEQVGSLSQAVDRAIAMAKSDQMAVILSEQPELAVAAANRTSGIRAMVACGSHDWQAAAKSLGANLVVCHPAQWQDSDVPRLLATLWNLRGSTGPNWIK
ncbi:hypothetical protein [Bremerella sp. P1]|uniref:hypothetical protein n=1 Tax=Bremerella sp. P1 TaxID=3026424 RepID=UPI0023680F29|nr:hypothetical protein [Bremerella sp. P1]WDI40813.1 hypothetical protein PSR63_20285 [Bremerella sp. P1]